MECAPAARLATIGRRLLAPIAADADKSSAYRRKKWGELFALESSLTILTGGGRRRAQRSRKRRPGPKQGLICKYWDRNH
jgi:hypothetical protein